MRHFILVLLLIFCACSRGGFLGTFDLDTADTRVVQEDLTVGENGRRYYDMLLDAGEAGETRFAVSLPKDVPEQGLRSLLILSGLQTGKGSLDLISDHGNYALLAYEYPYVRKKLSFFSTITQIPKIRKAAFSVPAQSLAIVNWANEQPWSDKKPPILVGVSLGGMFLPSVMRLSKERSITREFTVIAYSGAGIFEMLSANMKSFPLLRYPLAAAGTLILNPLEPALHLPHMEGKFLVINGKEDWRVPFKTALRLQRLTPEPKKVMNLETAHVDPDRLETVAELFSLIKAWIEEQNGKR